MDSSAPHPPSAAAGAGSARKIAGTRLVLRIWQTGIDESRADEYRTFARRRSTPMFSSQPGFLGVVFAAAPRQRSVLTLWESRAAAHALEQSESYRHTVAAIEAAGFLVGASHVEIFELEAASLKDRLAEALSRVGDADSEVTGRRPGG